MSHATALVVTGALLVSGGALAQAALELAQERVQVNRRVPQVERPPLWPRFSPAPDHREIRSARVFSEPVVAVGESPTAAQSKALATALTAFLGREKSDERAVERFLEDHPDSPYSASVLLNLGLHDRRRGAFTRALTKLERAWQLSKGATDSDGVAVADRAIAELSDLHLRFGNMAGLSYVLSETEGRPVGGSSGQKLALAREGLYSLHHRHDEAVPSARTALRRVLMEIRGSSYQESPELEEFPATMDGASLEDVRILSHVIDAPMKVVKRVDGEIPVPSVALLKVKHYSAIVRKEGNRYLIDDPCLGAELWVTEDVLLEESTGFFLVPVDRPVPGFQGVEASEASAFRGKCYPLSPDGDGPKPDEPEAGSAGGGGASCKGMAHWSIYKLHASLHLADNPVGYSPPRGPSVQLQLDYNQRETHQPGLFSFSNVGPLWTHRWLSYLEDDPTNPLAPVTVILPGGGVRTASGYDPSTSTYARDFESRAQVVRVSASPVRYESRNPDGSIEVFGQPDGAANSPRRVFLTQVIDPQGQSITFTYDSSLRLVGITDAIGQVTTLAYELGSDPLKITKVTDPFGRFATLEYDAAGRLWKVTDVIGLTSEFTYAGSGFLLFLDTPYGRTKFFGDPFANPTEDHSYRWVEVEDPLGGRERVEYAALNSVIPSTEAVVPLGFAALNANLQNKNSFYWDKRAMSLHPRDYTKAEISRWLQKASSGAMSYTIMPVLHSFKKPLESRVWFKYHDQANKHAIGKYPGPSQITRVLDDGATQAYTYDYNEQGMKTLESDPMGRTTLYFYAANGVDLEEVRRIALSGGQELLQKFTYDLQHRPLTGTDTAAQTTTHTYNAHGQPESATTPARAGVTESRTTTYSYDVDGRLETITGPAVMGQVSYTYDDFSRIRTYQNADGHMLTYDYDALDRVTKVTFPDGSYEETVFNRLDAERRRDRLGKWTIFLHDALRRLILSHDAQGQSTSWVWCACGSLDQVRDAKSHSTTWERDLQGRVIRELRSDGSSREFAFDSSGRLTAKTDPMGQETHFSYFPDGQLKRIDYLNAVIPTASVHFTYDATSGYVSTMVDGAGTTTYEYVPIQSPAELGAGQVQSIDGPLEADTVTYTYDELGRVRTRALNGTNTSWVYDSFGRLARIVDPLGEFTFGYEGTSARVSTLSLPNGQSASYSYFPNEGDRRLREIRHLKPGGTLLGQFSYSYASDGSLLGETQQLGTAPPTEIVYGYNQSNRLISATQSTLDSPPVVLRRFGYGYDAVGNRTTAQVDNSVTQFIYDDLNRLARQEPGGALLFSGATNEAARVTLEGALVGAGSGNEFFGRTQVSSGVTDVELRAVDTSGNERVNVYEVVQTGDSKTFAYDPNGNLVSSGSISLEWNAANRLVRVLDNGLEIATFLYDGEGRRRRKTAGGITRYYLYDGEDILEERRDMGLVKRFVHGPGFDQPLAEVEGGIGAYYAADHLGSVRIVTNPSGEPILSRIYDPYGGFEAGETSGGYAFAGREWDQETGLYYLRARYYDPKLARFISEDPLGIAGSLNLYEYASGAPTMFADPTGLYPALQRKCSGGVPSNAVMVICCRSNGEIGICDGPAPKPRSSFVEECMVAHERQHIDDLTKRPGRYPCDKSKCKYKIQENCPVVPGNKFGTECSGSCAELLCLQGKPRALVRRRIEEVKEMIKTMCMDIGCVW